LLVSKSPYNYSTTHAKSQPTFENIFAAMQNSIQIYEKEVRDITVYASLKDFSGVFDLEANFRFKIKSRLGF